MPGLPRVRGEVVGVALAAAGELVVLAAAVWGGCWVRRRWREVVENWTDDND